MKQQTAVEWLYNNLKSFFEHDGDILEVVQMSFEQAKQMEKEQIIDAFDDGKSDGYKTAKEWDELIIFSNSEQYYNETFKTK